MNRSTMRRVTIGLSPDIADQIEKRARDDGRSVSNWCAHYLGQLVTPTKSALKEPRAKYGKASK